LRAANEDYRTRRRLPTTSSDLAFKGLGAHATDVRAELCQTSECTAITYGDLPKLDLVQKAAREAM
jgi:hypothetical protein